MGVDEIVLVGRSLEVLYRLWARKKGKSFCVEKIWPLAATAIESSVSLRTLVIATHVTPIRSLQMSSTCDPFAVTVVGDTAALFDKVKAYVESHGGVVTGNSTSGSLAANIPIVGALHGNYNISGQTVTITVTQKPFLLPCSTIEANVRKFLAAAPYYPGLKVAHSCHESSSFRPPEVAVMAILLPDARELSDDVLEALRLRALRGCELGLTEVQVAGLLGVARETVCRWWAAYAGHGVPALPQPLLWAPAGFGPRPLRRPGRTPPATRTHPSARRIGHRGAAVDPPCRPRPDPQGIRSRSGGADRRPVSEALGLHGQAAAPSRP